VIAAGSGKKQFAAFKRFSAEKSRGGRERGSDLPSSREIMSWGKDSVNLCHLDYEGKARHFVTVFLSVGRAAQGIKGKRVLYYTKLGKELVREGERGGLGDGNRPESWERVKINQSDSACLEKKRIKEENLKGEKMQ